MKLKTVRIVVESNESVNKRWISALKGKSKRRAGEEVISVGSFEVLGKIFSAQRLEILAAIPSLKPKSIAELSRYIRRDFKNVYSDVKLLADLGLIELLETGRRRRLVPVAKYSGLEFPLSA